MDNTTIEKVNAFISSCEAKRLEQLDKEFENSEEHLTFSKEIEILYSELKNALPDNLISLLNDYDDLLGNMTFARQYFYYKHGFSDAIVIFDSLFATKKDIKLDIKIL